MPYNSGQRSALASAYALDVLRKKMIRLMATEEKFSESKDAASPTNAKRKDSDFDISSFPNHYSNLLP